jgi:hypothetical protein
MKISVEPYSGQKKPTEYWEDRVKNALIFYGRKLFTEEEFSSIDVSVVFDKTLIKEQTEGLCTCIEYDENPKYFEISLSTDRKVILEKTLAHEIVHIKQYVKNELIDVIGADNSVMWKNQMHVINDADEDAYFDSPWEIEAFGREVGLYSRYFQSLDIDTRKSYGLK